MKAYYTLLLTGTINLVALYNIPVGFGVLYTPGGLPRIAVGLIGVVVI